MINLEQAKKNIPEILKKALKNKGITQSKLAELVGCDKTAISHYLSGNRIPSIDILISMCDVLDIDMNSFKNGDFAKASNIDEIPVDSGDILYAIATLMKSGNLTYEESAFHASNLTFINDDYNTIENFASEFEKYFHSRYSKRNGLLLELIDEYSADLDQEKLDKAERDSSEMPF